MRARRLCFALGMLLIATACCYYASDSEVKKICTDPDLRKRLAIGDHGQREKQVNDWIDKNVSSGEAKGRAKGLLDPMSMSDRQQTYDAWAKDHRLNRCDVVH